MRGPAAAFPVQAFQKHVSRLNPCVLGFFSGTQGCLCLGQHLGNQEISSAEADVTWSDHSPFHKEVLTVLTCGGAGRARSCAPEVLDSCW